MVFSCEDIHNVRVKMWADYAKMSPEDAKRDFDEKVAAGWREIERYRRILQGGSDQDATNEKIQ